jgi:hypothetical protein
MKRPKYRRGDRVSVYGFSSLTKDKLPYLVGAWATVVGYESRGWSSEGFLYVSFESDEEPALVHERQCVRLVRKKQ